MLSTACAHIPISRSTVATHAQSSFVTIQQVALYQALICEGPGDCVPIGPPIKVLVGSGSGGVIAHQGPNTRILTAKHVVASAITHAKPIISPKTLNELIHRAAALSEDDPAWIRELVEARSVAFTGLYFEYYINFSDGTTDKAIGFRCDKKHDICQVSTANLHKNIPIIKLASTGPRLGDRVYCASAPFGNAIPGHAVPYFSGLYSGTDFETSRFPAYAWYTFPASPGSSGSLILNDRGEFVGVLIGMSVGMLCTDAGCTPMASGVTIAVPYKEVKKFLDE